MPDMRDRPFKTFAVGPSSGQDFKRRGQTGRTYAAAAADIQAMSLRFTFVGREVAEEAIEIMRENTIKYLEPGAGDYHGYSTGRIAATTGRWDPDYFVDSEAGNYAREQAEAWAAANVPDDTIDTLDELTIIENGAYSSVKRFRSNIWSAEMGTFTPYAGLVEDGGSMEIAAYGNPKKTFVATWEAQHAFKRGVFDSYGQMESLMRIKVQAIVS